MSINIMNITNQVNRIKNCVVNCYNSISAKGGSLPQTLDLVNLPNALKTINMIDYFAMLRSNNGKNYNCMFDGWNRLNSPTGLLLDLLPNTNVGDCSAMFANFYTNDIQDYYNIANWIPTADFIIDPAYGGWLDLGLGLWSYENFKNSNSTNLYYDFWTLEEIFKSKGWNANAFN